MLDELRAGPVDRAVRAGRIGQRVGVDRELRRDCDIARDIGIGTGVRRAAVTPLGKPVTDVGNRRDWRAVAAVLDELRAGPVDRAVRASRVG